MEKLPPELKQHICGFLDFDNQRSIRVLNRTWARVAAAPFFEKILITPLSLERLRLIAQHEYIATCVKCIIFYADLVPCSVLPENWLEGPVQRVQFWGTDEDFFRCQRFALACREQQHLRENNHKLNKEIIDLSIPMLKGLQCLKLATRGPTCFSYEIHKNFRSNQLWSRVWYDLEDNVQDNSGNSGASQREIEISNQFAIVLNALANSGVHIRKLDLMGISLGVLQKVLQPSREPYCPPLSTLKSVFLDTTLISRQLHNTTDGHCELKALHMLLEEAQSLQTLKLDGIMGWGCEKPRADILKFFRP